MKRQNQDTACISNITVHVIQFSVELYYYEEIRMVNRLRCIEDIIILIIIIEMDSEGR